MLVLGFSASALHQLRQSSRIVEDSPMMRLFQEEVTASNLQMSDISLRMSTDCYVPMTWGLVHKTVLLPNQAADWSESRLRLVLRHELAHIARGDLLVSLLTTLAALLLWFHPLAWLMLRSSQHSREQACDDLALSHSGQNADDFADELLAAVASLGAHSGRTWLPMALAMSVSAGAKAMRQRLANLVQAGRTRLGYSRPQKMTLLLPMTAAAFGLSGLTACRKAAPVTESQILVTSRFISIPVDSPVLTEMGLTLDGSSNLQNLGILSEEQTGELLRKLSQQKGIDLMSAPSVTTKSGHHAIVEVVREFIYPTEFEPAKQLGKDQPIIPTTPTAFEMRPVGVRMEVEPSLKDDGTIDLTLTPEVTSFEGFLDYGTPIQKNSETSAATITENKIQQPVFHSLKTTATVAMHSGQSVVFGGLGSSGKRPIESIKNTTTANAPTETPKTKDLIFFIIQASTVEAPKATSVSKVAATSSTGPTVTIFGQVMRQGKYDLKPGMTVKDLIDQAGGLSARADKTKAELIRGHDPFSSKLMLNLTQDSAKQLKADDVLTVPSS